MTPNNPVDVGEEPSLNAEELSRCFDRPLYKMNEVRDSAKDRNWQQGLRELNQSLTLIKITSVAYRDRRDIRKALAQFYGVLHAMNVRFLYIIRGSQEGVEFYIGVSDAQKVMCPEDVTHSLLGVMPGCQTEAVNSSKAKRAMLEKVMTGYGHSYLLTGVPTCQVAMEKRELHQEEEKACTGIERLIDSVSGEDFVLSILCEPLCNKELVDYRKEVADLVDLVKPLAKRQVTEGRATAVGETTGTTFTKGVAESVGRSKTDSEGKQNKKGNVIQRGKNYAQTFLKGGVSVCINSNRQWGETATHQDSFQIGKTRTETVSETKSLGISREQTNMEMSALSAQLEKFHKRLLDASGEGMWKTCVMFHAHKEIVLKRAAFAATAIWQGADSAVDPIRCLHIEKGENAVAPQPWLMDLNFVDEGGGSIHPFGAAYSNLYTCLTHKELAHIADFPHWDLPGITVLPLVEYARISPKVEDVNSVELGGLIDRATINRDLCGHPVRLSYAQLNKHCFVSGVTGSGKSTTMRKLLKEISRTENGHRGIPFMVIEPAKREYRELQKDIPNLMVYSLGRPDCDFALNPFSFGEDTPLFSHLDFLKSAFNAMLGSYSSMPFILETILCECYKTKGWDLDTGQNIGLEKAIRKSLNPDRDRKLLREKYMPTIGMMAGLVDQVLNDYFGDDKSDYRISLRGAMKARLKSLTSSLKGKLLNRQENFPFEELLEKNVVFELESFSDNEEKSFIMALLLARIYEIRQAEVLREEKSEKGLRHIVILEEAHRLLTKTEGKGELQSNPRAKAVETFSDMLAEVRSYGQGMIIVDQIPSKLTPEVMKNTEVKIVHRLLSKDDREAVGATMNLNKEQIENLARHNPGEATMYFGELTNALHVKITP